MDGGERAADPLNASLPSAAATGAKAIAIHPKGVFCVVTDAPSKGDAEEQALKKGD